LIIPGAENVKRKTPRGVSRLRCLPIRDDDARWSLIPLRSPLRSERTVACDERDLSRVHMVLAARRHDGPTGPSIPG